MLSDFFKKFLQLPILLMSFLFGFILLGVAILTINLSKVAEYQQSQTTADLRVIAGPTSTPTSPPPTRTPAHTPTNTPTATLPPGELGIGAFVMIEGTGDIGLNIREAPGTGAAINFIGAETEVFQIIDGPVTQDGYTWWYLAKPGDESKQGWAAQSFFNVIEPSD